MMKIIAEDEYYIWEANVTEIAKNRANYYSDDREDEKVYEEEYEYTMNDTFEILDWYQNNMNPNELTWTKSLKDLPEKDYPDYDAELFIKE